MQTGSSGCRYNWLTIVMLLALVLGYSQRQQRHCAAALAAWATCRATLAANESDRTTATTTSTTATATASVIAVSVKVSPAVSSSRYDSRDTCHAHR